jgi:DNA-binding transcriptional MerR regulator
MTFREVGMTETSNEIGLLSPSPKTKAGYWLYSKQDLEVLQQIKFFKEMDFTFQWMINLYFSLVE